MSDIFIPKHFPENHEPQMACCGLAGYYRLVLRYRDGRIVRDTGWFKNVITNSGMVFVRDSTSWFSFCMLGSGSTTPAITDTNITTPLDGLRKSTSGTTIGYSSTYIYYRYTFSFTEGQSTGNVRELGNFQSSSGGNCFNHSLVLDGGGSPTTIVKGADQILDVYYEIRNYPKLTDTTGTIDISGTSYNYTVRAAQIDDPGGSTVRWKNNSREILNASSTSHVAYTGGDLGATTESPTGTSLGSLSGDSGFATSIIGTGSYYNDVQLQVGIDSWNHASGIRCVQIMTGNCVWQIKYVAVSGGGAIPKTDEDRLRLRFRLAWTRI